MKRLKVGLIGSRGIPASYGGYETLMEELSTRLVARGHDVTVYCRSHYTPRTMTEHRGVRLVVLPTIRSKHLDTPVHTALSCLHAVQQPFDVVLVVNAANSLFVPLLRASDIPVALHVDGIERRRAKWGPLGRAVYALSEWLAIRVPDIVVTDAETVKQYYAGRWQTDSVVITYGVAPRPEPPGQIMKRLHLEPRRYLLYVSRFEPENNPHRVVEAYAHVPEDFPLVMVGGAPYAKAFIKQFTEQADSRIVFPGPIYGQGYRELLSNALAYIHATEVGGTHPALIEAMGYANCVVVNDTPENREAAGDVALYFRARHPKSLVEVLSAVVGSEVDPIALGERARARAADRFRWERVVDGYLDLFSALVQRGAES